MPDKLSIDASKARRPRAEYASPSADISTAACLLDEIL
jgi:hypothetical protein